MERLNLRIIKLKAFLKIYCVKKTGVCCEILLKRKKNTCIDSDTAHGENSKMHKNLQSLILFDFIKK